MNLRDLLYELDSKGNVVREYCIKNVDERTGTDRIGLRKLAQTPGGSLLVLDSWTNAMVFRLVDK